MPLLVAALIGGLVDAVGTLIGKAVIALGLTFVTVTGVNASLTWIQSQIAGKLSALPATIVDVLGMLHIGTDIGIVAGAISARLVFAGVNSLGSLTRAHWGS